MTTRWEQAQRWERDWWDACVNTYGEEEKQILYADRMGLQRFHDGKSPYNFDVQGRSVLDIGGGPCSLLLKCVNVDGAVVDPLLADVPAWVQRRYECIGIHVMVDAAEDLCADAGYDEAWIYNVLQHVKDPAAVIKRARLVGEIIRLFEWIDTPVNEGHLHTLTEDNLNEWLGGEGRVERFSGQAGCYGTAYYGVFEGAA